MQLTSLRSIQELSNRVFTKQSEFSFLVLSLSSVCDAQCGCSSTYRNQRSAEAGQNKTKEWRMGDLIMNPRTEQYLFGNLNKFRAATLEANTKWPNKTVPYYVPWPQHYATIDNALNELSRRTGYCVKFKRLAERPKDYYSTDYVHVYDGGEWDCSSQLGRQGGGQRLSLGKNCLYTSAIQHEFMHALGFYHEQSRSDRDQHIIVNWDNIYTQYCHQFRKCKNCALYSLYNPDGIMQYSGYSGSCNGKLTMQIRSNPSKEIPHNNKLQETDVYSIKRHYDCF